MRINDLARELEVKSKEVLDALDKMGVEGKRSHSSSLEEDQVAKVRAFFGHGPAPSDSPATPPPPAAVSAPPQAPAPSGKQAPSSGHEPAAEHSAPHAPAAP